MFGVVPKPLWEKRAPADDRNRITLAMRPLLVRGARTMIIDAGIGDKMDEKSAESTASIASGTSTMRWPRPASRSKRSTSCSRPTCISIMPEGSRSLRRPAAGPASRGRSTWSGAASGRTRPIRTSGTARATSPRTSAARRGPRAAARRRRRDGHARRVGPEERRAHDAPPGRDDRVAAGRRPSSPPT